MLYLFSLGYIAKPELLCNRKSYAFKYFYKKIIKLFYFFDLFYFLFKKLVYLLDWIYFWGENKSAVIKINFLMAAL
ncbi:hypothetical protein DPV83_05740 [Aggregatibacter segnis]|uniref:Uncharacterized protein n=1 Tax=Aggregatibacter segnis TaxID=739 RepID=A0A8B2U1B1_9PAST|nr:hypothetical protein DPV83_05740 [Aggregatibacter segnis]